MPINELLVASYPNRTDAETASNFLTSAGFDRRAISFIGKDCAAVDEMSGFYKTNDHIRYWGREQAIWDQDLPAASFHLPEIGPLLVTGPLAQSIVRVLRKAIHGSGLGALEIGFNELGIPRQSARRYQNAIASRSLLLVHGTEAEITVARDVLHGIGPIEMECHIVNDMTEPFLDGADPHTVVAPVLKTRLIMSSSRHILFPTDFSERAKGLLPYAGNIARKFAADVTLLHVLSLYEGIHPGADMAALNVQNVQDQAREQSEAELLRLGAWAFTGVNVIPVVESGDIAQCIARTVSDHDIGLIVIPTHGRGKFRQLLLGSVTSKVLHDNACPVWTMAHAEALRAKHSPEIHDIVCAVDSTPDAGRVLEAAADLASVYGANIHLIHAIPIQQDKSFSHFLSDTIQEQIAQLQRTAGTRWELQVKTGAVPHVVRDAALQQQADLVIIGRGQLSERLGGLRTHLEAIIREAPCAVLSV